MSDTELREYLQKSRQQRRDLLDKADLIVHPSSTLLPPTTSSQFPNFNAKRFLEFKDSVNISLQHVFKPKQLPQRKIQVLKKLTQEENYKKIYMPKTKSINHSRKCNSSTPSQQNYSLFPRFRYKETYLTPLFPKPSKDTYKNL